MPKGRHKAIHGVGVICPFELNISHDSPFTGLFKSGTKVIGFMRMSWSAPNFLDLSTQPGLTPGVSIKFLRSGTSSANFVTTNSMESLPDKNNFFSTPLSNHIPAENSTTTQSQRFCNIGLSSGTSFYNIKANRSPDDQEGFNLGEVVSND